MNLSCSLVLLGGGKGERFNSLQPKQYTHLCGEPLILHALHAYQRLPFVQEVVVVCEEQYRELFLPYSVKIASPGTLRQDSVFSGLQQVSTPWVCIHDGVRPFVYADEVIEVCSAARKTGAAALASPATYTIKSCAPVRTLDRDALAVIHTPQCLDTEVLREGLLLARAMDFSLSDDTEAAELLGIEPTLVFSNRVQIKVTYPEDLLFAETLLSKSSTYK